jgi:hypothetical protein
VTKPAGLYRIVRRPHGLFFVCEACCHEVNVNSFPRLSGVGTSKRTQAADAMREHYEQAHALRLKAGA